MWCLFALVTFLAEEPEHVRFIDFHPGLVERIYP